VELETDSACIKQDLFQYAADANGPGEWEPGGSFREAMELVERREFPLDGRFDLKTEAWLLKLAYTNNKVLSLSNSRTQILAHQVESTHRIINSLNQRFLLADEVGLGKTIEAGLVIKELVFRYGYERILIVCPASLLMQWQNEMESKFSEQFVLMDRSLHRRTSKKGRGGKNPWTAHGKVICSIDFIKSRSHIEELEKTRWDVIIFDEAHRLRRDSLKSSMAYNMAEILSANTKALLLLTATPFRGKIEELYYLVRLIDKNLLGPFQTFYNSFCIGNPDLSPLREKLSQVIIRRTKKEVGGFTRRHARTIRFELYPDERLLYDETTRYVTEEFNRAMQAENRAVGFVMTVFQKLLDSSSHALLMALTRRRAHLESLLDSANRDKLINSLIAGNIAWDGLDADDEEEVDAFIGETLKKTFLELKEEIATLDSLISLAGRIEVNKKGEKLREIIARLESRKIKKFLIFTQFKTTQDYLRTLLSDYRVEVFHGSMDKNQKEQAILNFRDSAQILISTEAGGEGRNLQFCNVLVNYDLPWSPLKIEQRIGRIHRFGQASDVFIYNFSTADTVAERVLQVLTRKLRLFEESIGTPDILLGQIEEELNLNRVFMDMALKRKHTRAINSEIDAKMDAARKSYEKLTELAISTKLDLNYDEYYRTTLREREYSNRRIEQFVGRLCRECPEAGKLIGKKNPLSRLYSLKTMPDGSPPARKHATFDSERALENENMDFLAFGHPVVDSLIARCQSGDFGGITGVRFIRHRRLFAGLLFNFLVSFTSNTTAREIIPVCMPLSRPATEDEIEEIEKLAFSQPSRGGAKCDNLELYRGLAAKKAGELFERAAERVRAKADFRAGQIIESMRSTVQDEIGKINAASDMRIREYEEQLERQECQMKWFDKDMKSAITRTRNRIAAEKREREKMLQEQNRIQRVKYAIELLNAGLVISQ
jgi:superfamily II DNA or RNA helicase